MFLSVSIYCSLQKPIFKVYMIRSQMFISPSCCSVYVRVPNPSSVWNKQTSVKHKKLAKKRKADHGTQRETPASAVYTNLEWKQYSSVILSGRCRSSVRARGAGARLPPLPLLWLAPPEWLLWSSAEPQTSRVSGWRGRGVPSRHLWVNLSKWYLKRKQCR